MPLVLTSALGATPAGIFRNKGVGAVPGPQGIVSGAYQEKVDIVSIQYSHSF